MFDKFLPFDDSDLPIKHQIGRMIIAGIAVIGIRSLVEKAYDVVVVKDKSK